MIKRSFLFACLYLISCQQLIAQQVVEQVFYFKVNSYDLSSESRQLLLKKIDSLKHALKNYSIKISGHTDNSGSENLNYELSQKRAMTVKNVFVESGIPAENISVSFNGANFPVASNETKEGKQLNRRVEIKIEITVPVAEKPIALPVTPEGDISELYALLKTSGEQFCIDVTKDTFLVAKRGTIIHYKANTIKKQNLSCKCFTLSIKEYFDNTDLLFNNLTTTSDGQLLESGGMIKLDGYCDNKKYELKPGEFFTVMVPTDTVLPRMKLLSANRENDGEYLNWQLDKYDPTIDDFDWERMRWACKGDGDGEIGKCPFFFCRIGNFIGGILDGERKNKSRDEKNNREVSKEKELMKKYQLIGEDLDKALQKSKDASGKDALKYYVYKNSNWDYRNIDRYKPGVKFVDFIVTNNPSKEMDIKIIFKQSKTVVPSLEKTSSYIFKSISEDAEVWVVGLRYSAKKEIFLGLKEVNTSTQKTTLDFKLVSVDELKRILEPINKRS